ncbi:MAG: MptD family putative ECF transporter S component [Clostridiales bacterium]|nr:MptD family putative ECF transporter S component [Clostridiales bacterium]
MKVEKKNVLRLLLYAALYAVMTALVCITGSIHPVFFVCYQITAGLLLSGIIITAFRRIDVPGAAACLSLGLLSLLLLIRDAALWHVIPLVVIAVLAESVRAAFQYSWTGDVIATVFMSFSSFGYYGQIWFNRAYTYECAIEEMPAGYADTLMALSPAWLLPVVIIVGILLSILISHVTATLFKLKK